MFDTFVESTLLMFVAIDPISLIPIFAGLTAGLNKHQVNLFTCELVLYL